MRMANEYERADRERDTRKHDPRPSDPIPLRLQPKPLTNAHEIALLVRALANIDEAAALIEQYARTAAAEARLDGVLQVLNRILAVMDGETS